MTITILIIAILLLTARRAHPRRILPPILLLIPIAYAVCRNTQHPTPNTMHDTLPSRELLFAALRNFHTEQTNADLSEFQTVEKFKWMNWVPSFGVGYNLQGQPRPMLTYSFGQVKANITKQEETRAKMVSILRGGKLAFFQDSINLDIALKKYEILRGGILATEKVLEVEDQLWEIVKEKYNRKEILPVEYLNELKNQVARGAIYKKQLQEIDLQELEIYRISRY